MQIEMTNRERAADHITSRPGRVKAQTTREWAYGYSNGKNVWPAIWGDPPEGYISVPVDYDPKFKAATNTRVKAKPRVRFRL